MQRRGIPLARLTVGLALRSAPLLDSHQHLQIWDLRAVVSQALHERYSHACVWIAHHERYESCVPQRMRGARLHIQLNIGWYRSLQRNWSRL